MSIATIKATLQLLDIYIDIDYVEFNFLLGRRIAVPSLEGVFVH